MSHDFLNFVVWSTLVLFCYAALWIFWRVVILAVRFIHRILRRIFITEHIGTVMDRKYSQPRVEEDWLYCLQLSDPCTSPWLTMEPPVLVRRNVPALPHVCVRRINGDESWHECTAGEYAAWTNGALMQIDVYAIFGWTFYTSEPKLVA